MKIETATDLSSDIWSDLKDNAGNEIKASVELPLDGEKRFYRFSSDWSEVRIHYAFNFIIGRPSGTRTPNQLIKSQLLYRLS